MEIVTKKNAYWGSLIVPPNKRFTVPDEIGQGLIARGIAEQIPAATLAEEKKGKGKK